MRHTLGLGLAVLLVGLGPGASAGDRSERAESEDQSQMEAAAIPLEDVFRYRDFSETPALSLIGDAAVIPRPGTFLLAEPPGSLRLNRSLGGAQGASWYPTTVSAKGGFVSRFRLRFTEPGAVPGFPPGADGIAFLIRRADAPEEMGDGGCGIGYSGLPRTVAVEFDTFDNSFYCGFGDPNDNHISLHVNRSDDYGVPSASEAYSIASTGAGLGVNLKDGLNHDVMVRYERGVLSVFVDDMSTPRVAKALDLAEALNTNDGNLRVGFVASTASAWEGHYVLQWRMQAAAGLCPLSDWVPNAAQSSNGVQAYRRAPPGLGPLNEYLFVVDLNTATLHNLIELFPNPTPQTGFFVVRPGSEWINRGQNVCPPGTTVRLVRNGAFGPNGLGNGSSTNVAHGLTDSFNGGFSFQGYETPSPGECSTGVPRPCCPSVGRMPRRSGSATLTCGARVQAGPPTPPEGCWRVPEEFRTLNWDNGSNAASVSSPWAGSGGADSLGGFAPDCVVSGDSRPRNFAGVVNSAVDGVTSNGQILLYTAGGARTSEHVQQCLESFGATRSSQVQFDGGGSVFLNVNGADVVAPSRRALTSAQVVCSP
jgi:hypothetical protein